MYDDNKRLALNVFWVILGAVLIGLTVTEKLDSGMYSGMGGALMAIGVLRIGRTVRYRKDSDYRKKIDTELNDERNEFLRMKSWTWTGTIVIILEGIGVIAAMIAGRQTIQLILSYSLCLILVVYCITYMILRKKY